MRAGPIRSNGIEGRSDQTHDEDDEASAGREPATMHQLQQLAKRLNAALGAKGLTGR